MGRRYSKARQTVAILGLIGIIFTGALGMTGCTPSELKEAQSNIDTAVTEQLNCEEIQAIEKELIIHNMQLESTALQLVKSLIKRHTQQ